MIVTRQDRQLVEALDRIAPGPEGWKLAHMRLSALKPHNRQPSQVRSAISIFEATAARFQGSLYQLPNQDLVYVWKGAPQSDLERAVGRVRFLFDEDPLCRKDKRSGMPGDPYTFCHWYDLGADFDDAMTMARKLSGVVGAAPQAAGTPTDTPAPAAISLASLKAPPLAAAAAATPPELTALNPALLGSLEGSLSTTDLAGFVERQPICVITGAGPPVPVLQECYVSIAAVQKVLSPGVDLLADRALFQHLTRTLDRRVLDLLSDGSYLGGRARLSVNLNISTVLSGDFARFHQVLSDGRRGMLAVEFQMPDVFADIAQFRSARDFVTERGYRTIIDGITHMTLPFVDRKLLKADLMKIFWCPELHAALKGPDGDSLRARVVEAGADRVILCRCDDERAIDMGSALGLRMFQGRYVDTLLASLGQTAAGAPLDRGVVGDAT